MKMLLGDQWVDRDRKIEVLDPYDNSVIDTVPAASVEDVETAFQHAVKGYETARKMTVTTGPRSSSRRRRSSRRTWRTSP